jgi:hypothetical protein
MAEGQAQGLATAAVTTRPKLATVLAPTTVPVLAMPLLPIMAAEPATGLRQQSTPPADTGRTADTGAMVAGAALTNTASGTGTRRLRITARASHMDRATITDRMSAAMALALATRRELLAGRRTAQAVATDTARARRPIAGIARDGTPATRAGRVASTTDRATATTRVIGTGLASHVAVTASAQPMAMATDRRGNQARTETDTRPPAVTSAAGRASAMTSCHRTTTGVTTTGETTSIQGRLAMRTHPMPDTAKAGKIQPTVTVTTGRTGPSQVLMARAVRSTRLVAVIRGKRSVACHQKDSLARATVRADRGSTEKPRTGRLIPRRGLVPLIG